MDRSKRDAPKNSWLDRTISAVAPAWGLKRTRARLASDLLKRHYEAATVGRRGQGWNRSSGDPNALIASASDLVRRLARDLVRNNAHASAAVRTIANQAVGWGITAKPLQPNVRAMQVWDEWAGTTACDADGRSDIYGLQKLVVRTVVESGECLIRRRFRLPQDGLPIPMQIQVMEPDYLDTLKTDIRLAGGSRIINGVQFDAIGRRTAYWMFREYPGSSLYGATSSSEAVPAESVLHVFCRDRPGQVRGMSWFSPVAAKLKDFDEYDDAQLLKQKIAAYLAVIIGDPDGTAQTLGPAADQDPAQPYVDRLKPGAVIQAPPGRTVDVVQPPRVAEFRDYAEVTLRTIATGLDVTYEDMTGDYADMPFSAARMSRLAQWDSVHDWREQMLIPQFCNPVWAWAMETATIAGLVDGLGLRAQWTAPPLPMIDPAAEGLAYQRNIRAGIMSHSEALRERGYDPEATLEELAGDFRRLDRLGLVLDIDPRKMSQAGQAQATTTQPPDDEEEDT